MVAVTTFIVVSCCITSDPKVRTQNNKALWSCMVSVGQEPRVDFIGGFRLRGSHEVVVPVS